MSVTPTLFGIDFIKVTQGLRSPLGIAALSACIVLGRRLLRRDPYQIRDVAPIIRNPKKDVVYLFEFDQLAGGNASPYCLKLETYLRMAGINFEVKMGLFAGISPRGKVPFIQFNDQVLSDSSIIISFLKEKFGDKLDSNLTAEQQALTTAIRSITDDRLANIIKTFRWVQPSGWPQWKQLVFGRFGFPLAFLISRSFHPSVVQDCWIGGFGRFTEAELLVFARQDLDALAHFLGDKKFIFGDDFHEVDASVYGTIAQFFNIPIDTPLHALAKEYKTLHAYYQRISEHIESLPALVKCQQ